MRESLRKELLKYVDPSVSTVDKSDATDELQFPWVARNLRALELGLLAECKNHAVSNSGELQARNIVVIHPFYDQLSKHRLPSPAIDLLQALLPRAKSQGMGVVLVDSPEGYARESHKLGDQGLISRTIFTKDGLSAFYEPRDAESLRGTQLNYFGGTYRERCVAGVINQLEMFSRTRFKPISDALVHHTDVTSRDVSLLLRCRTLFTKLLDRTFGVRARELVSIE